MEDQIKENIKSLAKKSSDTMKPDEALKLSQSALNLTHVLAVLKANKII